MICTSSCGTSVRSEVATAGVSLTIDARTDSEVSPVKGRSPVTIS